MKTALPGLAVSLPLLLLACGDSGQQCEDRSCGGAAGIPSTTSAGGTQASGASASGTGATQAAASTTAAQGSATAASTGNAMADAEVGLTFTGTCSPDFSGMIVVASNADSVAVSATGNFSSVQLALQDPPASIAISTAERVANGDVINVVSQNTTWSNISSARPDPIGGTLVVNDYQEQAGIFDVVFQNVVLENVQNQSLCTVNGSLKAFGTSF